MRFSQIINPHIPQTVRFSDSLDDDQIWKCLIALKKAQTALEKHGFGYLLEAAPLLFHHGPIMGQHGWTDPKTTACVIDGTWYDEDETFDAILHELGHRLHLRQGVIKRASVLFRFMKPTASMEVGPYGQTNHYEMFAELFRRYIRGRLSDRSASWIASMRENEQSAPTDPRRAFPTPEA